VGFVWWLYDNLKWCIIGVETSIVQVLTPRLYFRDTRKNN